MDRLLRWFLRFFFILGLLVLVSTAIPNQVLADTPSIKLRPISEEVSNLTCFADSSYKKIMAYQFADQQGVNFWMNRCNQQTGQFISRESDLTKYWKYPGDPTNWETWNDVPSSVNVTRGRVINLFENVDYGGKTCISLDLVDPNMGFGYFNLAEVKFDNMTSSYILGNREPRCTYYALVGKKQFAPDSTELETELMVAPSTQDKK